ncbi:LacI family DNA-binding transcriptional regulator [Patulibacter defluvii]|uniref:LacI family DNA-binding transcriptional regulator n=1 Tax=Patulibacter defluvii TaxID=3095358 RepID=UPI002A762089|nr:LacI family DNA-binding transcriptional regulator [Patulibacter sp. DM4]
MRSRPTIKDVAAAAGVSVATASMAMRDTGRLSDATRERVKRAAAELGYQANAHARSLRGGRSRVLALTMPGIRPMPTVVGAVEYYVQLVGAAVATALEHDHALVVVPAEPSAVERLPVDGVIVVDPVSHDPLIDQLAARAVPIVTVGRPLGHHAGSFPVVDNDFVAGAIEVLDHLAATGAARPALIACDPPDSFQGDSIEGYRRWCADHGTEPLIEMAASESQEDADAAAEALLASGAAPDAVYGTVDQLAEAVLRAAPRHGLSVPGDLRVATCSDSELARRSSPPLTVLDDRGHEIGIAVVERLLEAIEDRGASGRTTIPTDLIVRGSTVAAG